MNAEELIKSYESRFTGYITMIEENSVLGPARVIDDIMNKLLITIMKDVGSIKNLSGKNKKKLVLETLTLFIEYLGVLLNERTFLGKKDYDDSIRNVILILAPTLIDSLISVEGGKLVFNKRWWTKLLCCK